MNRPTDPTTSNEKKKLTDQILSLTRALPLRAPLVHVIPNGVSAAFCADVMAAAGARPVMADYAGETEEITAHSCAFVANMGQPSPEKEAAVRASLKAAAEHQIPAVLDPVGAGASAYRLRAISPLLQLPWNGILKGNASEIQTLQDAVLTHQGVDAEGISPEKLSVRPPKQGRVLAVTGSCDRIVGHDREVILSHIVPRSRPIVGTGCAAGCLCGCFAALTEDLFSACAAALSFWGFVQSQAEDSGGYGSCRMRLLDLLPDPDLDAFALYLDITLNLVKGVSD